jgi:hypothetical protein
VKERTRKFFPLAGPDYLGTPMNVTGQLHK